ncbi:hypothetical protein SCHIN_v1c05950 [Spiroplasma chinense]|uniref:Lipoprotein n=1 Tax=Spiroplasma chinense TaxID=216932 RepID=A0A5B9Y6T5_9MOLU|nr:lipoprotein [Spiroplasma chinense]QEH61792.1 hypothetical protein SCHIN_v1c05950 [Spiroplasma chinense]
MKKLLSLLAATGLVATTSATVVACGDKPAAENDAKELTIAKDATEVKVSVTVKEFVETSQFSLVSDKAEASILEVKGFEVKADALTGEIVISVKADAKREADVTEAITVKYGEEEVVKVSVTIAALEKEDGNGGDNGNTDGGDNGNTDGGDNGNTDGGDNGNTDGGDNGNTDGGDNGNTDGGDNGNTDGENNGNTDGGNE